MLGWRLVSHWVLTEYRDSRPRACAFEGRYSGPGEQVVGALSGVDHELAGAGREVGEHVLTDAARDQLRQRGEEAHERDNPGDAASGAPHDRSDGEREHAECRIGAPNAATSLTTNTTTANTAALAESIGVRRGTASRLARMVSLEYSLAITNTPSIHSDRSNPETSSLALTTTGLPGWLSGDIGGDGHGHAPGDAAATASSPHPQTRHHPAHKNIQYPGTTRSGTGELQRGRRPGTQPR